MGALIRNNLIQKQPLEVLKKKGGLRNFAKFTKKKLYHSLLFNKDADFFNKDALFIKKETRAHVFSCEFCQISKKSFFTEDIREIVSVNI